MSVASFADPFLLAVTSPIDSGVSDEAIDLRRVSREIWDEDHSIALGDRYRTLRSELVSACQEASARDWDGYSSMPVLPGAYERALAFVESLPSSVGPPEVSVHPDGEIAFEWQLGRDRVLTVTVGSTNLLRYALLDGVNTQYGREAFVRGLPSAILASLGRLFAAPRALPRRG